MTVCVWYLLILTTFIFYTVSKWKALYIVFNGIKRTLLNGKMKNVNIVHHIEQLDFLSIFFRSLLPFSISG